MATAFQNFVNEELPKRPYTLEATATWGSGRLLVTAGPGYGVESIPMITAPVQSVNSQTGDVVITTTSIGAVPTSDVGALNGVAELVGGKLPSSRLPAIAVTDYLGSVASEVAMLALSGEKGDWCTRSDLGLAYIITGDDPTLIADWTVWPYPTAPVISVNGETGIVVLSAADVGADPAGTAAAEVSTHVGQLDPHTQYQKKPTAWATTTAYSVGDLVYFRGALFHVNTAHTSTANFADGTANCTAAKSTRIAGIYNTAQNITNTNLSSNLCAGDGSLVIGGASNQNTGDGLFQNFGSYSVITGGQSNRIWGHGFCSITGGSTNSIGSLASIGTLNTYNHIGGGRQNTIGTVSGSVTGDHCGISSGYQNKVETSGVAVQYSYIGGGYGNTITGSYGFIGGGGGSGVVNTVSGTRSAVVGGNSNTASGQNAVVLGGSSNSASAAYSTVGGTLSTASGTSSACFGQSNTAGGTYSSVLSGNSNSTTGQNSVILSGSTNTITKNNVVLVNARKVGDTGVQAGDVVLQNGLGDNSWLRPADVSHSISGFAYGSTSVEATTDGTVGGTSNRILATTSATIGGQVRLCIHDIHFMVQSSSGMAIGAGIWCGQRRVITSLSGSTESIREVQIIGTDFVAGYTSQTATFTLNKPATQPYLVCTFDASGIVGQLDILASAVVRSSYNSIG